MGESANDGLEDHLAIYLKIRCGMLEGKPWMVFSWSRLKNICGMRFPQFSRKVFTSCRINPIKAID